jgi:type IX secretion system PorP/SprF family membrane protein
MKKIGLLIVILAALFGNVQSQQLPLYSQYMMNGFLLNPAMAGSVDYLPLRVTARKQWVGIDDAPSTYALSGHYLFKNIKFGLGGYIFSDKFGPISRTGIQVCAAYHLPLESMDSKLSFGLSFSGYQFKLDESQMVTIDENDPALTKAVETTFAPDANFGVYLYGQKYYVGVAATQLVEFKLNIGDNTSNENKEVRHYFVMGGYKFGLGKDFELEPSLMLKGTEHTPFQVDVNVKGILKKNYWLGFSYRTSKDIVAMLGVKVDRYLIGYSFDYTTSNIKNYSKGTHEIMLGVNIGGASKGSSLL